MWGEKETFLPIFILANLLPVLFVEGDRQM